MRIVENSYYEHDEHGVVKVIDVTNGVVSMQKKNKTVNVARQAIPAGVKQSAAGFQDDAEPADINISANAAVFDILGKEGQ